MTANASPRIRPYDRADAAALALIFHRAVQVGSESVYSQAQRDGWSKTCPDTLGYEERLEELRTFVAVDGEGAILGFISIRDSDGYLDLAFVAPEHIRQGVGAALYTVVERHIRALGLPLMTVEASVMSKHFFVKHGWTVTGRRRRGSRKATIRTWLMQKTLTDPAVAG